MTQLGLFGYNPNSRFEQPIRQARKDAEQGIISWEKADSISINQFEFLKEIQHPDSLKKYPSYISWNSFSKGTLSELVTLKIPIYIAYGSADIIADFCDLLPIYFIQNRKENYTLKRYANLEHNFFPIDEKGIVDYKNGQWKSVISDFLEWMNHTK